MKNLIVFTLGICLVSLTTSVEAQLFSRSKSVCVDGSCNPSFRSTKQANSSWEFAPVQRVQRVVTAVAPVQRAQRAVTLVTPPYPKMTRQNGIWSLVHPPTSVYLYAPVSCNFLTPSVLGKRPDTYEDYLTFSGNSGFNRTIRNATREARARGEISRLQQLRINTAISLPRISRELESLLAAEFALETNASGLIDWENFDPEKFLELVKTIILILQLFGIGL